MIHQRYRQTDGQTTCDSKTTLCTVVHRAVKTPYEPSMISAAEVLSYRPLVIQVK